MLIYEISEPGVRINTTVEAVCVFFGPRSRSEPKIDDYKPIKTVISRRVAVSPGDIYQDRAAGATHVVVNMSTLSLGAVYDCVGVCSFVGVTPVFEVHSKEEMKLANKFKGQVLVNRTDIFSGITDLDIPLIASKELRKGFWVTGSISNMDSVMLAKECGASAVIVAEAMRFVHFGKQNESTKLA